MLLHTRQSEAGIGIKWGTGRVLCRIEIEVEEKREGEQRKGGARDHRRPETLGKQENGIESLLDVCCTERQDWVSAGGNLSGWGGL